MQELHDRCSAMASITRYIRTQPDHSRAVDTDIREGARVLVDTGDLARDGIVGKLLLGVLGREIGLERVDLHKIKISSERN